MFLSYRCELADGMARTALYLTVTSSKANYLCSLPYLSQILRTTPQMSGSSPGSAFSKVWMSLKLMTASDVTSEGLKVHSWQRFGNTRGADEAFLFAQMQGAWSKKLDTHKVVCVIQLQEIYTKYMNIPRFSFIAASYHSQVKPQAVPRVSFLVPSPHSICSEKSHCLPYTTESSMAELTATTPRSQPSSCSSSQQISWPCWCLL